MKLACGFGRHLQRVRGWPRLSVDYTLKLRLDDFELDIEDENETIWDFKTGTRTRTRTRTRTSHSVRESRAAGRLGREGNVTHVT